MVYSYAKPKTLLRKIGYLILFLASIYSVSVKSFQSINYIFLTLVLVSAEGFQLDMATMRFRKTTVFWKWHFGKWIPISEPLYIVVIRAKDTSVDSANNPNDLIIRLFLRTNVITVSYTQDYDTALKIANDVAERLQIPIHNKTTEHVI